MSLNSIVSFCLDLNFMYVKLYFSVSYFMKFCMMEIHPGGCAQFQFIYTHWCMPFHSTSRFTRSCSYLRTFGQYPGLTYANKTVTCTRDLLPGQTERGNSQGTFSQIRGITESAHPPSSFSAKLHVKENSHQP